MTMAFVDNFVDGIFHQAAGSGVPQQRGEVADLRLVEDRVHINPG